MIRLIPLLAACALVPLAACNAPAPVPSTDGCGAAGYADTIGTPISDVVLPTDRPVRVLGPNDMATTDYIEDRINFETDGLDLVARVTCG